MSDTDLARAIHKAAEAFNRAVERGQACGLDTDIRVAKCDTYSCVPLKRIDVDVIRKL